MNKTKQYPVALPELKHVKRCPHCWKYAGVETHEFKVKSYIINYYDSQTRNFSALRDQDYEVSCLTCTEPITFEDFKLDGEDNE